MDLNLRGKLALVTGAPKRIGLACARRLVTAIADIGAATAPAAQGMNLGGMNPGGMVESHPDLGSHPDGHDLSVQQPRRATRTGL
jgi:NAD(P)-dependent dehydrogenase (short-subunit alcohol dehydrogenase family)